MPKSPLRIKTPGKLNIAGEFAVLEPHQNLITMAVNRFVYTTIESSNQHLVTLENFGLHQLHWDYTNRHVHVAVDDTRVNFVKSAMEIALQFLEEQSIAWESFSLTVKSELDDESGKKYGLGSSAAVSTSVISAILTYFLPERPTAKLVFQLAATSHVATQGNGSGADVAASSHGGLLEYASFQAEWLSEAYKNATDLHTLLQKNWKYLTIKPISIPSPIYMCIGWTGKPASTAKLVDQVLRLKLNDPQHFQLFLDESREAVAKIGTGLRNGQYSQLMQGIKENRRALQKVGDKASVPIETPLLKTLCDLAEQYGGAGKSSGAGGGDCGIAFMPTKESADALISAWERAGIKSLDLQLYPYGAKEDTLY